MPTDDDELMLFAGGEDRAPPEPLPKGFDWWGAVDPQTGERHYFGATDFASGAPEFWGSPETQAEPAS